MKKNIPNFLTCCNLMVGAVGIIWIGLYQNYNILIFFIFLGAFFDLLDGLVARALGVQSEIGKQLDSLADLVTFGVLPALALFYSGYSQNVGIHFSPQPIFVQWIPLLIIPFSALRLAKFNVSTDQSDEFRGLPTPANAIMISGILLMDESFLNKEFIIVISLVSCFLLVSNIRMIALKFKSMGWKGNEVRYLLLVLLIAGFGVFQLSFIPFVIPTYIAFSIIGNYLLEPVVFE